MSSKEPSAPRQLALQIDWDDGARFESFYPGDNAAALAVVRRLADGLEPAVYLCGATGAGKSHLLQAACRAVSGAGGRVAYIPLEAAAELQPALLEGLERLDLVALDDLDAVAADACWEEGLFHAYNRCRDAGTRLLAAGSTRPDRLGVSMPDLVSRLQWGPVHALVIPDDEGKLAALRHRAALRGLDLPRETGLYLLRRYPRDPRTLFALLEELDTAALEAQRRLTVPFLKSVLEQRDRRH